MKAVVDTCIVLDVLLHREPFLIILSALFMGNKH